MDVYPGSRNKSRHPTLLAAVAAGLALAAVGWTVGLLPGDGREEDPSAKAGADVSSSPPATVQGVTSGELGNTPSEAVIADCNRFAAEVQGSFTDAAESSAGNASGAAETATPGSSEEAFLRWSQ